MSAPLIRFATSIGDPHRSPLGAALRLQDDVRGHDPVFLFSGDLALVRRARHRGLELLGSLLWRSGRCAPGAAPGADSVPDESCDAPSFRDRALQASDRTGSSASIAVPRCSKCSRWASTDPPGTEMNRHPDGVASTTPRRSDTLRHRRCARIGQATSAIGVSRSLYPLAHPETESDTDAQDNDRRYQTSRRRRYGELRQHSAVQGAG